MKSEETGRAEGAIPFERIDAALIRAGAIKLSKQEITEVADILRTAYYLPAEKETAAVAIGLEKTAALFYDRIWSPYPCLVPRDMHFCGASQPERAAVSIVRFQLRKEGAAGSGFPELFREVTREMVKSRWTLTRQGALRRKPPFTTLQRDLAEEFWKRHKIRVVPIYSSKRDRNQDFPRGPQRVLVAVLSGLPLPIEKDLSWEQVAELRKNQDAKAKCRRLLHWLDADMAGKSVGFISDRLATSLANYEKAVRKHGIKTFLSAVAGTFRAASIPTVLTHIAQQRLWVSLLEGILIGGGTLAKVTEQYIDSRPEAPDEVAWVYEVKKRMK